MSTWLIGMVLVLCVRVCGLVVRGNKLPFSAQPVLKFSNTIPLLL